MEGKEPVLAKSNSLVVDMRNRASGLTIDDIVLEPGNFGYCKAMQKECKPEFLTDRWEKGDTKNLVNGRPALTMESYLICVAGKGKITPYTDGKVVAREEDIDLYHEFVFSIPIYDNLPTYNNESHTAFPDPKEVGN